MGIQTVNPSNNQKLAQFSFETDTAIQEKINRGSLAFETWKQTDLSERIKHLREIKKVILKELKAGSELMHQEMGKKIVEAEGEIKKCGLAIDYFCEHAPQFLADQEIKTQFAKSYITYQPQGVILGIMPWNFPYWQVLRFAIPTLLAGNTVLIKHAPNVQGTQNLIQSLIDKTSLPTGVFQTIIADIPQVESVISNPKVRGISFTGSERGGRSVAELAGKHLKKTVLELGGSDPYLVFEDADIDLAVSACVKGRFLNSGQSCVAAKRWIIHQNCFDEFLTKAEQAIKKLDVAPMARLDLKVGLKKQVIKSMSLGAEKVLGDNEVINDEKTCYFPPTLLSNVSPGMPAFDEELFGPVAVMIKAKSNEEAIELGNKSSFGLGGAIFSQDQKLAESIAKNQLDTGGVYINDFYKSTPELPFGGVKNSGIGRELSHHTLYEFCNIKTIAIPS